jgi:hypothetical protein
MRESKAGRDPLGSSLPDSVFSDTSSLMTEARARAAAIIAKAKAEGTYPKRRPGDRY